MVIVVNVQHGMTAFMHACASGCLELVEEVFNRFSASPSLTSLPHNVRPTVALVESVIIVSMCWIGAG